MEKLVKKPWGYEIIWAHAESYVGKILFISQGNRLSLQHHKEKEETIRVLDGKLTLIIGPDLNSLKSVSLGKGENYHISPGQIHRFVAEDGDVTLVEVSTTELDDIVRHEDDYGRNKGSA